MISANINFVPMLKHNFKEWKENVVIVLGCMDLNLALRIEQPTPLTDKNSTEDKRDFKRWFKSLKSYDHEA